MSRPDLRRAIARYVGSGRCSESAVFCPVVCHSHNADACRHSVHPLLGRKCWFNEGLSSTSFLQTSRIR